MKKSVSIRKARKAVASQKRIALIPDSKQVKRNHEKGK